MGAQIAAHVCNAGYPVALLDISATAARDGLERARRLKPDPFFTPASAHLIRTGGFDANLGWAADADWIRDDKIRFLLTFGPKNPALAKVPRVRDLLKPGSVEEVSRILRLATETGTPIVPQGGNTGLVAGAVPFAEDHAVLLSLGRLNRIRKLDPVDYSITVEAGCILQQVQQAAAEADRLFPLSLGAEGSCQIGGNLSTNAGGVNVLRYGNTRELVLGLDDRRDIAPELVGEDAGLDVFVVFEAVADDGRVVAVDQGHDRQQFRLAGLNALPFLTAVAGFDHICVHPLR